MSLGLVDFEVGSRVPLYVQATGFIAFVGFIGFRVRGVGCRV